MRLEGCEPGSRRQLVQKARGEALVQSADDLRVLPHRLPVGTVAQPTGQRAVRPNFEVRLKAEDRQHLSEPINRILLSGGRELAADLPAGSFNLSLTTRGRRNGPSEPPREVAVALRALAARARLGGQRPLVAGATLAVHRPAAVHEPRRAGGARGDASPHWRAGQRARRALRWWTVPLALEAARIGARGLAGRARRRWRSAGPSAPSFAHKPCAKVSVSCYLLPMMRVHNIRR